jgi:hypothetical protein
MFVQNGQVRVFLVDPNEEHSFGTFILADGEVSGTGQRGISYKGNYRRSLGGGLEVTVTADIPEGTEVTAGLITEVARSRTLNFHLSPNQIAGVETKAIALIGFGIADVRFLFEPHSP